MMVERPLQVLLVEDNPADVRLTREVLQDATTVNEVHVTRDGVEALDYLNRRGEYTDAERPDFVILDLNMPRKDGREVLAEMHDDASLRSIPVAVLTTSTLPADIIRSYELGANCFLAKPVDLDEFFALVKALDAFWLGMVRLPPDVSHEPS
jgi:CheY-like chemotaxis protein